MRYGVGSGTVEQPRYGSTGDEGGRTTTSIKLYQFTQQQVNTVITQLRSRFQYKIFVLDQNDNVIFDTNKPQPNVKQKKASANGLVIKIRV